MAVKMDRIFVFTPWSFSFLLPWYFGAIIDHRACPNIYTAIEDDDQQVAIKLSSVYWFTNPFPVATFLTFLQVIMKTFTVLASMLIALPAVLGTLSVDTPFVPLVHSNI